MPFKQCEFVKTNGARCGSPAMRNYFYCYFHRNCLELTPVVGKTGFKLPVLEDAEAIQVAITKVIQALAFGTIDPVRAKFMLYGLQVASQNLKRANFKPSHSAVVTDPTSEMLWNHYCENPLSPKPIPQAGRYVAPNPTPGLGLLPKDSTGKP
jgi:hypothetical protein